MDKISITQQGIIDYNESNRSEVPEQEEI